MQRLSIMCMCALLGAALAFAGARTESGAVSGDAQSESVQDAVEAVTGLSLGQWPTVSAYQQETGNRIASFKEAPILTELVNAGSLPNVDNRLPDEPAVVEPAEKVGQYGGTWRRVATRPTDNRLTDRMGYEPLIRRARDAKSVIPNIASGWDVNAAGTEFVFYLREGMKWSDGEAFTADDIMFRYEDVFQNPDLSPVFPVWLSVAGSPVQITKIDDYTVKFSFAQPHGLFLENMTFRGGDIYHPKHYMSQHHPRYADQAKLEAAAKAEGFEFWYQRFQQLQDARVNPQMPGIRPWRLTTEATGVQRQVAERNAYYWKVDTVGQQLPYIDRVTFDMVESAEIANFKAMAGELDMHSRYMAFGNYTLFVENSDKNGYEVRQWINPGSDAIKFNLTYQDPVLRELFNTKEFRLAMSNAIDREEIANLVYLGVAVPWQAVPVPADPFYVPPKHLDYDPAAANDLLDGIGLTARDSDGFRLRPDGEPLQLIVESYGAEEAGGGNDMLELLKDYWEAVGIKTAIKIEDRSLWTERRASGEFMVLAYRVAGIHWALDPNWFVPLHTGNGWAPAYAHWYESGGSTGEEPTPEIRRLIDLFEQMQTSPSDQERQRLGQEIINSHVEDLWMIGTVRYPAVAIVKKNFRNVPQDVIQDWRIMAPGYVNPEQFFIEQ